MSLSPGWQGFARLSGASDCMAMAVVKACQKPKIDSLELRRLFLLPVMVRTTRVSMSKNDMTENSQA